VWGWETKFLKSNLKSFFLSFSAAWTLLFSRGDLKCRFFLDMFNLLPSSPTPLVLHKLTSGQMRQTEGVYTPRRRHPNLSIIETFPKSYSLFPPGFSPLLVILLAFRGDSDEEI